MARRLHRAAAALLLATAAGGCGGVEDRGDSPPSRPSEVEADLHQVLTEAETFTIYALHPYPHQTEDEEWADRPRLDDYVILGEAEVDRAAALATMRAVYQGIRDSDGTVAACFNPRHGIRATLGDRTVDLVICYECLSMQAHRDGEHAQNLRTTEAPGNTLTAIWREAGLTIHGD